MEQQSFMNMLISNVISEKLSCNCRLCLREFGKDSKDYLKFDDVVILDPTVGDFLALKIILEKVLGPEISDKIPALDVVCTECAQSALECYNFMQKFTNSTKFLHTVLENLSETLNMDDNCWENSESLYIIANEFESKVILMTKTKEKKSNHVRSLKKRRCHECNKEFKTLQTLKDHHTSIHNTVTCDKCYDMFPDHIQLELHLNTEHRVKCPDCPQYQISEQGYKAHQEKSHGHYVCIECGKIYKGKEKLKVHEESHNKKKCPNCGKTYHTKKSYLGHIKLCSEGKWDPHPFRSIMAQPFTCDKCGKSYSTQGGLRVHERFIHGDATPHVCTWCNKTFTAPSYLRTHIIKHTGEKKFKCNICNRNFVSKEALLYHTRRHTGEKPYSCKKCGERFVNASARAEHIKFKHVGPTLMCEICSRKFVTKFFLKKHINKHHDPYSKLYTRQGPADVPSEENMRIKVEV